MGRMKVLRYAYLHSYASLLLKCVFLILYLVSSIHLKNELLCRNILSGVCHIGYASSATLMSYQVLAYVCPVSQLKRMKYYILDLNYSAMHSIVFIFLILY